MNKPMRRNRIAVRKIILDPKHLQSSNIDFYDLRSIRKDEATPRNRRLCKYSRPMKVRSESFRHHFSSDNNGDSAILINEIVRKYVPTV